ncbi:MAG: hypothetical protein ACRD1K_01550 [Acidimicrobiales bacterium]
MSLHRPGGRLPDLDLVPLADRHEVKSRVHLDVATFAGSEALTEASHLLARAGGVGFVAGARRPRRQLVLIAVGALNAAGVEGKPARRGPIVGRPAAGVRIER